MSYIELRENRGLSPFVSDIYVEIRRINNIETIVAYLGVDNSAVDVNNIISVKANLWTSLSIKMHVLDLLNSDTEPAYMMFCDENMTMFHLHSFPYDINNYMVYNEEEFKRFIESLGNIRLSGRLPQPPKYPETMSAYSVWHYSLDNYCKCRDIDYIELTNNLDIKAVYETTGRLNNESHLKNSIERIIGRLDLQKTILTSIANDFSVNGYFIIHTRDLNVFYIYDLSFNLLHNYSQDEYVEWLNGL